MTEGVHISRIGDITEKDTMKLDSKTLIHVFSKEVRGNNIRDQIITDKSVKEKFQSVISSFLYIGTRKNSDELNISTNCEDWITSILTKFPNFSSDYVKFLIRDFTDNMKTRMREEEKYVFAIVFDKTLILCHSRIGERTITPEWDVYQRMLDKDNIIRYVHFDLTENQILVTFYEHTQSQFFIEWLGLTEKESFAYFGGKNRIHCELFDSKIVFEVTDEDFEKNFLDEKRFRLEDNQIVFPKSVRSLLITKIDVPKKKYSDANDFVQDFIAKKYELSHYTKEYKKVKTTIPYTIGTKIYDEEKRVISSDNVIHIKKKNPDFHVLFCDAKIDIRASYLSKLKTLFLNSEKIKVFHAGMNLSSNPIRIKQMEFFNDIEAKMSSRIIDFYESTIIGDIFSMIFLSAIFSLLQIENSYSPISYFFASMSRILAKNIDLSLRFNSHETKLIEFKSRSYIDGTNIEIIQRLKDDFTQKLENSNVKAYFFGVDERSNLFEPIPLKKYSNDRLDRIEKELRIQMNNTNIYFSTIPSLVTNNGLICAFIFKETVL